MRKTLFFLLIALPVCGFAQSVAPRVVASGGVDGTVGAFRFSAVVGEAVAATYGDGRHFLTVGFEQPFPVSAPLPLEWLAFTGRWVSGQVELEWATAREVNTNYFVVQRSGDGVHFDSISVETTARSSTYHSVDGSPLTGKNYYRIRQVDIDGRSSYSDVVLVEISGLTGWSVYPNPAHGHFALAIRSVEAREIFVDLCNLSGRVVASRKVACSAGTTVVEWGLPTLPKGQYVVSCRGVGAISVVFQ